MTLTSNGPPHIWGAHFHNSSVGLQIQNMFEDGLFPDWNRSHSGRKVCVGDVVVEVNGTRGHAFQIKKALTQGGNLQLKVARAGIWVREVNAKYALPPLGLEVLVALIWMALVACDKPLLPVNVVSWLTPAGPLHDIVPRLLHALRGRLKRCKGVDQNRLAAQISAAGAAKWEQRIALGSKWRHPLRRQVATSVGRLVRGGLRLPAFNTYALLFDLLKAVHLEHLEPSFSATAAQLLSIACRQALLREGPLLQALRSLAKLGSRQTTFRRTHRPGWAEHSVQDGVQQRRALNMILGRPFKHLEESFTREIAACAAVLLAARVLGGAASEAAGTAPGAARRAASLPAPIAVASQAEVALVHQPQAEDALVHRPEEATGDTLVVADPQVAQESGGAYLLERLHAVHKAARKAQSKVHKYRQKLSLSSAGRGRGKSCAGQWSAERFAEIRSQLQRFEEVLQQYEGGEVVLTSGKYEGARFVDVLAQDFSYCSTVVRCHDYARHRESLVPFGNFLGRCVGVVLHEVAFQKEEEEKATAQRLELVDVRWSDLGPEAKQAFWRVVDATTESAPGSVMHLRSTGDETAGGDRIAPFTQFLQFGPLQQLLHPETTASAVAAGDGEAVAPEPESSAAVVPAHGQSSTGGPCQRTVRWLSRRLAQAVRGKQGPQATRQLQLSIERCADAILEAARGPAAQQAAQGPAAQQVLREERTRRRRSYFSKRCFKRGLRRISRRSQLDQLRLRCEEEVQPKRRRER